MFARSYDGPVFYAKDAMTGLSIANDYFGEKRDALAQAIARLYPTEGS